MDLNEKQYNQKQSMAIPRRSGNKSVITTHNTSESYKDYKGEVLVCIYQRVSSNRLEQLLAFDNQVEWTRNILKEHPGWKLVEEYSDCGVTGTTVEGRQGFLKMIDDAKAHKFQLIVTREISRFSRNILNTIKYTRLLKSYGCEVAFINDGIYTFDKDGELRISLLGTLAQDSSRHTSERAISGQIISREKHMLYGAGNLFGYNLIKRDKGESNRYAINEEEAETVRLIFDLYLRQNKGYKAIVSELVARKRKNATGDYKWSPERIGRILKRRTYSGYHVYGQSYVPDYLDHKRKNLPEEEHIYVKADPDIIPAIIDDSDWLAAREKRKSTTTYSKEGTNRGKPPSKDKWVKVLKCGCCNASWKRNHWRTNEGNGEEVYGYQCRNQANFRSKKYVEQFDIDTEGYCSVASIVQWKLEMQLERILSTIWFNPEKTISKLMDNIQKSYDSYKEKEENPTVEKLYREKARLEKRKQTLLEMRLDGDVDKEEFKQRDSEYFTRLNEIEVELKDILGKKVESPEVIVEHSDILNGIESVLLETIDFNQAEVDEDLIDRIVDRVVPCDNFYFKWYLNLTSEGNISEFDSDNYILYSRFKTNFSEAQTYRKKHGHYLRSNQWNDITTEIYIRL